MRRRLLAAACLILIGALATRAELPYLANPNRCDSSGMPPGCIPLASEMSGAAGSCSGDKWKNASTSFCTTDPLVTVSPSELFGVSGMSVEIAWRLETGRSDVVIAVHDSGIRWLDGGAEGDLRNKFYLNRGELPAPMCAAPPSGPDPRDCNGDGVFDMADYDADPRVTDMNGNGITDPEDRQRNGTFKVTIGGQDLDLSRFDGSDNRTLALAVGSGNDSAVASAAFRRVRHDLRTP